MAKARRKKSVSRANSNTLNHLLTHKFTISREYTMIFFISIFLILLSILFTLTKSAL